MFQWKITGKVKVMSEDHYRCRPTYRSKFVVNIVYLRNIKYSELCLVYIYSTIDPRMYLLHWVELWDDWIHKLETLWEKPLWSFSDNISAFSWRDWGRLWKTSVRTVGLWVEIRAHDLPNTKEKCWQLNHDFWYLQCSLCLHKLWSLYIRHQYTYK
jgi:hypothetical protein